jgi:glucokinase
MREELKKYFSVPVFVENDANCAALGEYNVLTEDVENMVFITLGTGVGGGLIFDRKLYVGRRV